VPSRGLPRNGILEMPTKPVTMRATKLTVLDVSGYAFFKARQRLCYRPRCSTPAPRSSVAKQWIEELAETTKEEKKSSEIFNNIEIRERVVLHEHLTRYANWN